MKSNSYVPVPDRFFSILVFVDLRLDSDHGDELSHLCILVGDTPPLVTTGDVPYRKNKSQRMGLTIFQSARIKCVF